MNIGTKIRNYLNRKIFRTPGVEFFVNNKDFDSRKKYINYWLNKAKKNKSLNKYFFQNNLNKINNLNYKIDNSSYEISNEMFSSLSNNGLLIIENALPQEERLKILEYFDLLGFSDPNVIEARKKLSSLMFK